MYFDQNCFSFEGVTSDVIDTCVETLTAVTFPLLERFGLEQLPEVKLVERGCLPNGKGKGKSCIKLLACSF